eukprot:8749997-Prorocentrum_lima.AAC.1
MSYNVKSIRPGSNGDKVFNREALLAEQLTGWGGVLCRHPRGSHGPRTAQGCQAPAVRGPCPQG